MRKEALVLNKIRTRGDIEKYFDPECGMPSFWKCSQQEISNKLSDVDSMNQDQRKEYMLVANLRTNKCWYVHRSKLGFTDFIQNLLGSNKLEIGMDGSAHLEVPKIDEPFWIGANGSMVRLLSRMLEVRSVRIVSKREN